MCPWARVRDPRLHGQTGLAPAVPHFANLPFALLHRTVLAGAFGHFVKRPFASLHGAAIEGAPTSRGSKAAANSSLRIWHSPARRSGAMKLRRWLSAVNRPSPKLGRPQIRLSPVAPIHAGRRVLTKERIVAVGLLTQRDLDVLGTGFHRLFAVDADEDDDDGFADLIAQLDKIDAITADPDAPRSVKLHLNRSNR